MKRFCFALALLALATFATPVVAQDDTKPANTAGADDGKDAKKDEAKEDEVEDLGIPADFNAYLKKLYPGLDPGGEHDLFNLKNYTDKDKRHNYTVNMTQLLLAYMQTLDMGSTISKLFDQYSRGKQGNQPTFKVLYAIALLYYPPGQPNVIEAQKLLREVTDKTPNYAYPWFVLAQFEYARFADGMRRGLESSPRETLQALDKALEIRPDFLRAMLLKGQIYMMATPPRTTEVRKLVEPWVELSKLPKEIEDMEDVLKLYIGCHKEQQFFDLVKFLTDSGKLVPEQRVSMEQFAGEVCIQTGKIDEAIDHLNTAIKNIDVKQNPASAMKAHRALAVCWSSKAADVRTADPELQEPGNKEKFDKYVDAATENNLICANVERDYLPLNLRGTSAQQYAQYLWRGVGKSEQALTWLKKYLDETDLTTAQRNTLENLRDIINLELNPTEKGLIERYQSQVDRDDVEGLAKSLGFIYERNRMIGEHFKEPESLEFFLSQLDSRSRLVVEFAALLAADTALQIGGDAIQKTGKALADRLEKETEMNSESQARLQEKLCESIKLTGHRPSQERAVRVAAKLVESATANDDISNVRTLIRGVVNVWVDDAYLEALKPAMKRPSRTQLFSPEKSAQWLGDLAEHLKNQIAAEAAEKKDAEKEPAKEGE
ncbi:MAG: hypothetical protein KDB68_06180 [Planctomycetes bacterium]|nr:hypothetical protein [Planctomycetota bacterium]